MNKGDSMKSARLHSPMRRQLIATAAAAMLLGVTGAQAAGGATDWGWPTPYEKVSDKSVKWLKDKGWWPIQVAFQAPWSGQNTVNIVMDRMGLLKQRGVDANWTAFASGPAINEVLISGRYQVGNGGNFPFTTLVDRKIPVKAFADIEFGSFTATLVEYDEAGAKESGDSAG